MEPSISFDTETITLEKIQIAFQNTLRQQLSNDLADVYVVLEQLGPQIQVAVHGFIWGQRDTIEIKYPATWVDAFKARWLPKSKINYKVHTIEAQALLPGLKLRTPYDNPVTWRLDERIRIKKV